MIWSQIFVICLCCVISSSSSSLGGIEPGLDQSEDVAATDDVLELRLSALEDSKEKSVVLPAGTTLKLTCEFLSLPLSWSYVQWIKLYEEQGELKHTVVPPSSNLDNAGVVLSSIILQQISEHDTANYTCVSTSPSGSSSLGFNVVVKDEVLCNDTLCKPHGRCVELINDYYCECMDGYTGESCNEQDNCFEQPCLNNGSCTNMENGFNCSCAEGFSGDVCEREVCLSSSCNGGGNCSETDDGKIQCDCNFNRAGSYCEHTCTFSIFKLRNRYCSGGIICVIKSNGEESCECQGHFSGKYCMMFSEIKNECEDSNICNKRGQCYERTYGYYCQCNSYATGKNCEFFDECRSSSTNICSEYGGTCVNLVEGYRCINCLRGQTGDKCQYKENPCSVRCQQQRMEVYCDMRFINSTDLKQMPIYFNSEICQLNEYGRTWSRSISYKECGTKVEYEGDTIVYRNSLHAGAFKDKERENSIITRLAGHFQFDMECRIPITFNYTSRSIKDYSMLMNESIHLQAEGEVKLSRVDIYFRTSNWQSVNKYTVGDRLYVEMAQASETSNEILSKYGFLKPYTCYATPDSEGFGPRYYLLKDGCIKDDTFRHESRTTNRNYYSRRSYRRRGYFSFQSFAFKEHRGQLYLHCNARFCVNKTENGNNFYFGNCHDMCKENEITTTMVPMTTTTSSYGATEAFEEITTPGGNGIFGRMKRAAIQNQESYNSEELINRRSGAVVVLVDNITL